MVPAFNGPMGKEEWLHSFFNVGARPGGGGSLWLNIFAVYLSKRKGKSSRLQRRKALSKCVRWFKADLWHTADTGELSSFGEVPSCLSRPFWYRHVQVLHTEISRGRTMYSQPNSECNAGYAVFKLRRYEHACRGRAGEDYFSASSASRSVV